MVILRRTRNDKLCPILSAKIMTQSSEEIPVIIQFNEDSNNIKESLLSSTNLLKPNLPLIDAFSGYLSADEIYRLSEEPNINYISFDSRIYTLLDIAAGSMEVYFPHEKGFEGEGITIAIIDTGVSPHNDLTRPRNRIIGFKDLVNNKDKPYDDNGHGTHVAGIIGGNGYSSRGKYLGVAPKANIFAVKALDENGGGSTSKAIEAISYVIETKDKYNTKILNLSIGTPANNYCENDPLCKTVNKAVEAGIVVVVAAGNSGPSRSTILSPGINENVITVGAVDDKRTVDVSDDSIASFSSRGPTLEGIQKPDLVAPGVSINSLSNTKLDSYVPLSGTSMATPLVSGSIALLLNKYGSLTPLQIKTVLTNSCIDLKTTKDHQGAGMLSLRKLFDNEKIEEKRNPRAKKDRREKRDYRRIDHYKKMEDEGIQAANNSPDKELYETAIMIFVILLLLDSRV